MGTAISTALGYITQVVSELFEMIFTFGGESGVGMGDLAIIGVVAGLVVMAIGIIKRVCWGY